jgi:hypothetical protein
MSDLASGFEAAQRLAVRAEETAEPIAADRTLSVDGRVAKVGEADAATKAEFATLEQRVRERVKRPRRLPAVRWRSAA